MVFQLRPEDTRAYQYPNAEDPDFLGYDRPNDRWKVDASGIKIYASGIQVELDKDTDSVAVWSASGTTDIPVYITNDVVGDLDLDKDTDSVSTWSASGTPEIPIYAKDTVPVREQNIDSDGYINDSAHHYAWNATSGLWQKVQIDPSTGAMLMKEISGTDHAILSNLNWAAAGHIIDSDIVPDASGTQKIGTVILAFDEAHIDKIYLEANPTTTFQAATKGYVDDEDAAADAHITSDGSSHTFIDQSVVSGGTPTFSATNFSDGGSNAIVTTTQETNWDNHIVDNSQAHSDYLINTGDTIAGVLTPEASGTRDLGSVTLAFDNAYMDKVNLEADPTDPLQAATKQYVDNISFYTIGISIDGGGSPITTGAKNTVTAPKAGTISEIYMSSDVSTTSVLDVWKKAGATPTVADTITASDKPTLTTATYVNDTDVKTWTTAVSEGDVFRFNADSNDNSTLLTLVMKILI